MLGVEIALTVAVTALVAYAVVSTIKLHHMEQNLNNLAQCFLVYLTNEHNVDIIEDLHIKTTKEDSGFNFPNSEGF